MPFLRMTALKTILFVIFVRGGGAIFPKSTELRLPFCTIL